MSHPESATYALLSSGKMHGPIMMGVGEGPQAKIHWASAGPEVDSAVVA